MIRALVPTALALSIISIQALASNSPFPAATVYPDITVTNVTNSPLQYMYTRSTNVDVNDDYHLVLGSEDYLKNHEGEKYDPSFYSVPSTTITNRADDTVKYLRLNWYKEGAIITSKTPSAGLMWVDINAACKAAGAHPHHLVINMKTNGVPVPDISCY